MPSRRSHQARCAGHPFNHVLARRNSNDDYSHAHFWNEVEEELDACQALREAVLQLPELSWLDG